MQADNIKNLFITLKIEAETESAHPKGSGGRRLWIRLGPKQKGYHDSVASQVHAQDFMPPRNGSLATYKRRLKLAIDEENRTNDDSGESDVDESEEADPDDDDYYADATIQASQDKAKQIYPLLTRLASDVSTLSDAALKILLGELINLQRSRAAESAAESNNHSNGNDAPQTPSPAKRQKKNPPTTAFKFTRGGALEYISVPISFYEKG